MRLRSTISGLIPLILFCLAVICYFSVVNQIQEYLYLTAIVKCLPIAALHQFVKYQNSNAKPERVRFLKNGLLFSGIGDACLVWPALFLCGVVSFSLAHLFYIRYYEIHRRHYILGLFLLLIDGLVLFILYPKFNGPLAVAIPIYSLLLAGMLWCSCDQVNNTSVWTICGAVGGVLFTVSDLLLLIDMVVHNQPEFHMLTMATYYSSQLAITLNLFK